MAAGDKFQSEPLTSTEHRRLRDTINVYNDPAFARMYFEKWRNDLPERQLKAFSQLLGPGRTVLDAGCGPGHHADYLHRLGHKTIGIDLSNEELRLARKSFDGLDFVLSNMLKTPFPAGAFAGIWACASVMHLPRILFGELLAEFYRILGPGGLVALTMTVESLSHVDAFGRFFEMYPKDYLLEGIADAGFQIEGQDERLREKATEPGPRTAGWMTLTARKA